MTHADNIEKKLEQLNIKSTPAMREKILSEASQVMEQTINASAPKPSVGRLIMKSNITKFAAAAAIIIGVFVGISMFNGTPAYAIEQTVEAMRSVTSIHAFMTDWDDSQGEIWLQINPETGQEEKYFADMGNLLIVATPQATYYYHKDKNLVRIKKEYEPASEISFSRIFEDLPVWVEKYSGKYECYQKFDEELKKEVIVIHVEVPVFEKEFYVRIDPETKLPIKMEATKAKPGQGVKSVYNIQYNVSIPEGLFEFEIPAGAKVVYE
ncbi:MAG: hypothetical protein ISS71_00345 [Phycisphaerae bacterium]|nr:hypothetical protein [Phycisphaerae bacterium]